MIGTDVDYTLAAWLLGWGWWRDPIELLINALAAYRLTRLLLDDEVPPLPRVRAYLHGLALRRWRARHTTVGQDRVRDVYSDEPPLSTLLGCPWCLGWWVSLVVMAGATLAGPWWYLLAVPAALSALVGMAALLVDREG